MTTRTVDAVIRAGWALSEPIDARDGEIIRVGMPSNWSSTFRKKAPPLTFQVSDDGETYSDLFHPSGEELRIENVTAGNTAAVGPGLLRSAWFKYRTGTSDSPVIQDADYLFPTTIEMTTLWVYAYVPGYGWMWIATTPTLR